MNIAAHHINATAIAEIIADDVIIANAEDAVNLIGNTGYQGFDKMILHKKNITKAFFDLKSIVAGDILQKFSNYRIRLVIIGDFSEFKSNNLRDFIYESNKGTLVNFLSSREEAIASLSQ